MNVAKKNKPIFPVSVENFNFHKLKLGDEVAIISKSIEGSTPVNGILVGLNSQLTSILREDSHVGQIVNHFPTIGYQCKAQSLTNS